MIIIRVISTKSIFLKPRLNRSNLETLGDLETEFVFTRKF